MRPCIPCGSPSTLTAHGVAVLRVLRRPRTLPQITAAVARIGAPLTDAQITAAVTDLLGAGHVTPMQRQSELLYGRLPQGRQALRAAFKGDPL